MLALREGRGPVIASRLVTMLVLRVIVARALLDADLDGVRADEKVAFSHAAATARAAGDDLDVLYLAALAGEESRYTPSATSRVDGGKRRTGAWRSRIPGPAFAGPYFCGVLQARAATWAECLALRPLRAGYAAGAAEIRVWLRVCRGSLRCATAAHGFGNYGRSSCGKSRKCRRYVDAVFRRYERLKQLPRGIE